MSKKVRLVFFVVILNIMIGVIFCQTRELTFPYYAEALSKFLIKHNKLEVAYYTGLSRFYNNFVVELETSYMNYGYLKKEVTDQTSDFEQESVEFLKTEYKELSENLLDELVQGQELYNKKILDVGCGKGGMTNYLFENYAPKQMLGVDISNVAIQMANQNFRNQKLSFETGNAMQLPVADNSLDIVVNIESSNAYIRMEQFYQEVYRVLKPGGKFLYTDLHPSYEIPYYEELLKKTGFIVEKEVDITQNVINARDYFKIIFDALQNKIPVKTSYLEKFEIIELEISATKGSIKYDDLINRRLVYKLYHFRKPELSKFS